MGNEKVNLENESETVQLAQTIKKNVEYSECVFEQIKVMSDDEIAQATK